MNKFLIPGFIISLCVVFSCGETAYSPKPTGYPRTDFPDKDYKTYSSDCPFTFEHGVYTVITSANSSDNPCWLNIDYPFLKGRIHFSYNRVDNNLNQLLEDARTLVYRHTIKADAINEETYIEKDRRVFARVYHLDGNTASSVQFYATDSTNHFVRGALYFNARTNADSLAPAIAFIEADVWKLIESLEWTEVEI